MSVLHKELRARARRGEDVSRALYREELRQAAAGRDSHLGQASAESTRIAQLLPGAVQSGLSMVEIAQLTRWSRPTLYRMLAKSRQEQDLSALARHLEQALAQTTEQIGSPAGLFDLAQYLQISQDELRQRLTQVFSTLADELAGLGSIGSVLLIDLLPEVPHNEKIVLSPLFLRREAVTAVAESAQQPPLEVIAWATLGLLRLLPTIRTRMAEEQAARKASS